MGKLLNYVQTVLVLIGEHLVKLVFAFNLIFTFILILIFIFVLFFYFFFVVRRQLSNHVVYELLRNCCQLESRNYLLKKWNILWTVLDINAVLLCYMFKLAQCIEIADRNKQLLLHNKTIGFRKRMCIIFHKN